MQNNSYGSEEGKNQQATKAPATGKVGKTWEEVSKECLEKYKDLWEHLAKL